MTKRHINGAEETRFSKLFRISAAGCPSCHPMNVTKALKYW